MRGTNTQVSVYDALLRDDPTILRDVQNGTSKLLLLSFAFTEKRAMTDYLKVLRAFMDELGFPDSGNYVFLDMSEQKLDNIFGARSPGSLLDLLLEPEAGRKVVGAWLDVLDVAGERIADYYPRCTYSLALADLAQRLNRVTR